MAEKEPSQGNFQHSQELVEIPEVFSRAFNMEPRKLLGIPLDFPYSTAEWDAIFEAFTDLLHHPESQIWQRAIDRLIRAIEIEASQRSSYEDYQPRPNHARLKGVLAAIVPCTATNPILFERFCSSIQFLAKKDNNRSIILDWLQQLAELDDRPAPNQEALIAAQLFFGAYDTTWQTAGTQLLKYLDHPDLNIRACAAYQIGQFYYKAFTRQELQELDGEEQTQQNQQAVIGLPPRESMMQLIQQKEIARLGVAGAFWQVIRSQDEAAQEWLLSTLERSPTPEPYISYFPCNLAFDAHERFCRDGVALHRLIAMGRADIAVESATDEDHKVPELEPLLIELGHHPDPEISRLASWQLAYYHHILHPRGAEQGYVELVSELPEIDLFLLFTQQKTDISPYAVVIYPKGTEQKLSYDVAHKWVDQLFPEKIRGARRTDLPCNINYWYERGYVVGHVSPTNRDRALAEDWVEHVIIGYRSPVPWNPRQFL